MLHVCLILLAAGPAGRDTSPATFAGRIQPATSVTLDARISGAIEEVLVKEGQLVKKGDVLVRIDGRLLRAELASAEAALARTAVHVDRAKADLARARVLLKRDGIAQAEFDQYKAAADEAAAAVAVARAAVDVAKVRFGMASIRAPFDGRAGRVFAAPGGTAKADKTPLVVVESVALVAVIDVNEKSYLDIFAPMRDAKARPAVEVEVGGKKHEGRVTYIAGRFDPATGTLRVHVAITAEGLLPGQSARVTVPAGGR
jgi:RND family efflux transporter MFP subunit